MLEENPENRDQASRNSNGLYAIRLNPVTKNLRFDLSWTSLEFSYVD